MGKQPIDHGKFEEEINSVALPPKDPVYGDDGHMLSLWKLEDTRTHPALHTQ